MGRSVGCQAPHSVARVVVLQLCPARYRYRDSIIALRCSRSHWLELVLTIFSHLCLFLKYSSSTSPESAVLNSSRSQLQILGSLMDPTDVVAKPGVFSSSPHLRGVDSVLWENDSDNADAVAGAQAELTSVDVPLLSIGIASPFPTPRDVVPDPGTVKVYVLKSIR